MKIINKYRCKVPNCPSVYATGINKNKNKHFFIFPKSPVQKQKWIDTINASCTEKIVVNCKKAYICEDHFSKNYFTSTAQTNLHKYAIPTIFKDSSQAVINTNGDGYSSKSEQKNYKIFIFLVGTIPESEYDGSVNSQRRKRHCDTLTTFITYSEKKKIFTQCFEKGRMQKSGRLNS